MQTAKGKADAQGRKAKVGCVGPETNDGRRRKSVVANVGGALQLANSYQELLEYVFSAVSPLICLARFTDHGSEFSSTDLKSVGNYTLGRLIGKGSFGKVYLASHKLTNGSKVSVLCSH